MYNKSGFFLKFYFIKEIWCYAFKGVTLCWEKSQVSLKGVEGFFSYRSEVFSHLVSLKCSEFELHTNSQQQKVTTLHLDTNTKPPTKLKAKHETWQHHRAWKH